MKKLNKKIKVVLSVVSGVLMQTMSHASSNKDYESKVISHGHSTSLDIESKIA